MPGRGLRVVRGAAAMRAWSRAQRAAGRRVGLVPTMGALHAGHLSLVARARRENERVVASVFVNPIQFGPAEDFRRYPRDLARDRRLLHAVGCDALFAPGVAAMYPAGFQTRVDVPHLARPLCGRFRPGHFQGVATVVAKLLHIVEPDRLYLGAKDYQQARVIERMVRDLDEPVRVVVCPTVREPDGLARSSRNQYLDPAERARAPRIRAALRAAAARVRAGEKDPRKVRAAVLGGLRGVGRVQYVEVLDARTLDPVPRLAGPTLIATAVFVGRARLIDNVVVRA
ncbi:MAG TPA: pantoate--beta-alanine ligase [Candidatus Saccharimonadales bacterium]|nr:pantoate--beta-alanine ligase [Candidatus Saccharimonadales bacterium]